MRTWALCAAFLLSWYLPTGLSFAEISRDELLILNFELGNPALSEDWEFEEAFQGMKIGLHSLIATGPLLLYNDARPVQEGSVTITFNRSDLVGQFLDDLFSRWNTEVRMFHPFADRGVEAVLGSDYFEITIHEGMILHLRNETPSFPKISTFVSDEVLGVVTAVKGKAVVSRKRELIRTHLSSLWSQSIHCADLLPRCTLGDTCMQMPDGSYASISRKERFLSCAIKCDWGRTCARRPDGGVILVPPFETYEPQFYQPRIGEVRQVQEGA